tara:strand:+ start:24 stop:905 length:882 start_codon:yes stop_codon:yes gene_type:complete
MADEYNVEFDDALLDLEGWKNPRYNGSKLTGRKINRYYSDDVSYGKNPVVENKFTAIFIGNNIETGEVASGSLEPMTTIQGHSYASINKVLLINIETDEIEVISKVNMSKKAFSRLITENCPEGSKIQLRTLDIGVSNQLKDNHFVKFNRGSLMKIYNYSPNTTNGHNDGVAGGYGVRHLKGTFVDDLATGSDGSDNYGEGLFSYGTTVAASASLFNTNTLQFVDLFPSEISYVNSQYNGELISAGGLINPYQSPGVNNQFQQNTEGNAAFVSNTSEAEENENTNPTISTGNN